MNKVVIVMCEGPHDVAFLRSVLRANNFKANDRCKIGEFPYPINNLLKQEVEKSNVEELNLQEIKQALLPTATLKKQNSCMLFYALGGDTRKDKRKKLIANIKDLTPQKGQIGEDKTPAFSIVYFFDADQQGVDSRLKDLNNELEEIFKGLSFDTINKNGEIIAINGISIGAYIFSDSSTNKGKLEDILLPLMRKDNESIFDNAEAYIKNNPIKEDRKKQNFDTSKSTIGIAGQLQKSGASNFDIIRQSDYLSKEKILEDDACKHIVAFFEKLVNG